MSSSVLYIYRVFERLGSSNGSLTPSPTPLSLLISLPPVLSQGGAIANADYAVIDVRLSSFEGNISGNGESNAIAIWNGEF